MIHSTKVVDALIYVIIYLRELSNRIQSKRILVAYLEERIEHFSSHVAFKSRKFNKNLIRHCAMCYVPKLQM